MDTMTATTLHPSDAVLETNDPCVRVLVVDGNSVNQRLWSHLLKRLGYKSLAVADGGEAIDALAIFPSDVILMDLDLPERGGFEAAFHIREHARHPARPWIIGITVHDAQPEVYDRAMRVGINDFLIKSGQLESLSMVMEQARKALGCKSGVPAVVP